MPGKVNQMLKSITVPNKYIIAIVVLTFVTCFYRLWTIDINALSPSDLSRYQTIQVELDGISTEEQNQLKELYKPYLLSIKRELENAKAEQSPVKIVEVLPTLDQQVGVVKRLRLASGDLELKAIITEEKTKPYALLLKRKNNQQEIIQMADEDIYEGLTIRILHPTRINFSSPEIQQDIILTLYERAKN